MRPHDPNAMKLFDEFVTLGSINHLAKLIARYELFKSVVSIPGDIVEGGVGGGNGLLLWAKLIHIFNPISDRKVIGFDTFGGSILKHTIETDDRTMSLLPVTDKSQTCAETILTKADALGLSDRIQLVQGDARLAIPAYANESFGVRFALLNLDFDTYDATKAALTHLYPLLVPGGVLILDEYGVRAWGESAAADEFFAGSGTSYTAFAWGSSPTAYVVKPPL